ncbi:MAG: hypothetical protein ACRENN_00695 [Candidatus Eiseniibacteriota bacterium]
MRNFWIAIAIGAVLCLAIGILWTVRLDVPSPTPWWYGKNAVVRFEVWEPGKDIATVAGTIPKGPLDAMYAIGLKAEVELDSHHKVELKRIWKELQRLPKGEKISYEEDGARFDLWIEVKAAPAS